MGPPIDSVGDTQCQFRRELMIQDQNIMRAVPKILQRSERQVDLERTLRTFVDVGVLPQLLNRNNQILYGRRGTGKTHVLRVLDSQLQQEPGNVVVYLDARTMGSTAQFADTSRPFGQRCLALFRDFLSPLYNALLEYIVEHQPPNAEKALGDLDRLLTLIAEPATTLTEQKTTSTEASGHTAEASVSLSPRPVTVGYTRRNDTHEALTVESSFRPDATDRVIFPALYETLTEVLDIADVNLYMLFDEWSSIPIDVQPFLAEFIKRGILPSARVVIKIAALEYRSRFAHKQGPLSVGFELGADIAAALDLDDYYVFDRNPEQITDAYANMILRHLSIELDPDYLREHYQVQEGRDLGSKLFTQRPTLKELARASEGVVRDLINIFTKAYFHAQRRGRDTIDNRAVLEDAREWFEQDKARDLEPDILEILRRIVDEVIGTRRARSFLLPRELEKHPIVERLVDARVLHHIQRGYADKDHPGVRYNIYSLDFGTYVDLMGTSKQPQVDLELGQTGPAVVVPFDDKRSIRRIVLDERVLEPRAHGQR
jgi:hypothetical protein